MSGDGFVNDDHGEPEQRLADMTDEELHAIATSGGDVDKAFAYARLRWFAESHPCTFGWHADPTGAYEPMPGWIEIPPNLLEAAGVPGDRADDVVRLTPVGTPARLDGLRAEWQLFEPTDVVQAPDVVSADGRRFPLRRVSVSTFAADLPAELARPILDSDPPAYEADIRVTVSQQDQHGVARSVLVEFVHAIEEYLRGRELVLTGEFNSMDQPVEYEVSLSSTELDSTPATVFPYQRITVRVEGDSFVVRCSFRADAPPSPSAVPLRVMVGGERVELATSRSSIADQWAGVAELGDGGSVLIELG